VILILKKHERKFIKKNSGKYEKKFRCNIIIVLFMAQITDFNITRFSDKYDSQI
jgi:hypothetical protein